MSNAFMNEVENCLLQLSNRRFTYSWRQNNLYITNNGDEPVAFEMLAGNLLSSLSEIAQHNGMRVCGEGGRKPHHAEDGSIVYEFHAISSTVSPIYPDRNGL